MAIRHFRSTVLTAAGIAAIALQPSVLQSKAALMPDGSDNAAYVAAGSALAGKVLWFQATTGTGGIEHVSATFLDPWDVLTAAHAVTGATGTVAASSILIGTGSNFLTNQGTVVGALSFTIYPGYDGTFETPDLAIIHLSQPLPGTAMTIASASVGEILEAAGFGSYGTPSTGIVGLDGNSRAWEAPVVSGNPSNVSNTYYIPTEFDSNDHVALNGKGLSGDSGGPLFDGAGDLVGVNVAQDGNTDPLGDTISLELAQPSILAWVSANDTVPEPSSLVILVIGAGVLSIKRSR